MDNKNMKIDKSMEKTELIQFASNLQSRLNKFEESNVDLRAQLIQCTEERDLIRKKFEEQSISEEKFSLIHEQMVHKDNKIMELNNIIMEKERQIIDLQEMCTEQGKVAKTKSLAFGIVNKRLHELDCRNMKDASTATDIMDDKSAVLKRSRSPRRNSPGRAIPQFKFGTNGNGSPPPIDPEDGSSYTTETLNPADLNEASRTKKHRKKVTFDDETSSTSNLKELEELSPNVLLKINNSPSDLEELLLENENLRQIISEMEKRNSNIQKAVQPESLQILKVKAAAQARIKEMEGIVAQNKHNYDLMTAEMHAIIEQLKESREWVLNENYRLQEQLDTSKEKCNDLHNELDTSLKTIDIFRKKLDGNSRKFEEIQMELYQNRIQTQKINDEKAILATEIERLKEAIFAQDEFISLLEGDLIVYEAHVGILRDSLEATNTSKKEDRQHLKSKAFSAKINVLESEKEEIAKKNNEEKLRVKAMAVKIKYLEEERDSLKVKIRQMEKTNCSNNEFEQKSSDSNETTMAMKSDELLKLEEEMMQKNAEIDHLMAENQKMEQQINGLNKNIAQTNSTIGNFLSSISLLIVGSEHISDELDNDLFGNLKFIEEKLNEAYQNFAKTNETLNLLEENVASKENEVETLKNEIRTIQEASELQKLELDKSKEEYQEILIKIQQKDNMIGTFEQRNADLAKELSAEKNALTSLETKNIALENELGDLRNQLKSLEAEMTQKKVENEELEEKLHSSKMECETLSATLSEQKTRLDKLISILTQIVNRFKMGSNLDDTFSSTNDSIDEFIQKIEMPSSPQKDPKKTTASFSKGIQVSLDGNEANELKSELQQREMQIKTMEIELGNEKKNSKEIQAELNSTVNSMIVKNEELQKYKENCEIKLEEAKKSNSKINLELIELKKKIDSMEKQRQIELENSRNNLVLVEKQTMTEHLEKTNQFVQTFIDGDEVEEEKINNEEEEENGNQKSEAGLSRKESQQLLVDCVKERVEFEQNLGDNVQQLLELKVEMENSVDVLKGEIWSLNSELKKHFDERDFLKSQLNELEQIIHVYKSQNADLQLGMTGKDEKMMEIRGQNDQLENRIKELNSLFEEKSQRINVLKGLTLRLKKVFTMAVQKWKLDLEEFRQLNSSYKKQFFQLIGQMAECTNNGLKHFEASRLLRGHCLLPPPSTEHSPRQQFYSCPKCLFHISDETKFAILASRLATKTAENEKLLRENSELIKTNLELQTKLETFMNGNKCGDEISNLETHFTPQEEPKMETSGMAAIGMEETKEANINVDMDLQKLTDENGRESKTDEPLDNDEGEKKDIGNEEEKTTIMMDDDWNYWNNQVGEEEEEEYSLKVDQQKEEKNSPIVHQKDKEYSSESEINQKKEDVQFGTKLAVETVNNGNPDDWNWNDQEDENDDNENGNDGGNAPQNDEWAWNDDKDDNENGNDGGNTPQNDEWAWNDDKDDNENGNDGGNVPQNDEWAWNDENDDNENGNDGGNTPQNHEWVWNDDKDDDEEEEEEMNRIKAGIFDHNVKQLFEDR